MVCTTDNLCYSVTLILFEGSVAKLTTIQKFMYMPLIRHSSELISLDRFNIPYFSNIVNTFVVILYNFTYYILYNMNKFYKYKKNPPSRHKNNYYLWDNSMSFYIISQTYYLFSKIKGFKVICHHKNDDFFPYNNIQTFFLITKIRLEKKESRYSYPF